MTNKPTHTLLQKNIDIGGLTGLWVSTQAAYYISLQSVQHVSEVVQIVQDFTKSSKPYIVVSGGTNLFFAQDFPGLVIHNQLHGWELSWQILSCASAQSISDVAKELETKYQVDTWKRFQGLPGSIGGAIYGNAGCFGIEVSNFFLDAQFVDLESGDIFPLSSDELNFAYRTSVLKQKKHLLCLSARFDLASKAEKYSHTQDNLFFRRYLQPAGYSCGSFFKNPSSELKAGALLEQVGLKGFKLRGAFFSSKHANFLMSDGSATQQDVCELILLAQQRVRQKFNIDLEPEVQIISSHVS